MDAADLALAERLADAAGTAIRPFFRQAFTRERKGDASPVTQADRAAEAAMRAILSAERPEDGIFGEEYGVERGDARRLWVLDPIDGTRSFVAGRAIFGTLIALLEDGAPVLGLLDQPVQRERWIGAAGRPTMFNGAAVSVRSCSGVDAAHLATTGPNYFTAEQNRRYERLAARAGDTLYGGDCYNYAMLATGQLDLVVEAGLKLYDFAALVPIVTGAGGTITDWNGAPLDASSDGRVIAAVDADLARAAAEILAEAA